MRHITPDDRGRITIPDVLFLLMTLFTIAAIWPVFNDLFEKNVGQMTTGTSLLYQMILPMTLLVIFTVLYVKAIKGLRF